MANPFRFKLFEVEHNVAAQKVSTDSVLLGAWMKCAGDPSRVLDVGAGMGILSLMAAQQWPGAIIDAIEIDLPTSEECKRNFEKSPWKDHLNLIQGDFTKHNFNRKYDLIVSNPPYFEENVFPEELKRRTARHDETLSLKILIEKGKRLLHPEGKIALVYPFSKLNDVVAEASFAHLNIVEQLDIVTVERKKPTLTLCMLGNSAPMNSEVLTLRNKNGNFTDEYLQLTNDFYLFLH